MRLTLTPSIRERLELLRVEVAHLEALEADGLEFEVVDHLQGLTETEKLEVLEGTARELTPQAIREMLAFTIQICAVCYQHGASTSQSIPSFIENLAAIARRTGSARPH